jgi:hypothetical protein
LDARASLLALGLSSTLCSVAWVRNHYRWVVWKLASYARRYAGALSYPVLQRCGEWLNIIMVKHD